MGASKKTSQPHATPPARTGRDAHRGNFEKVRPLLLLIGGAVLAIGTVYGVIWWQERPLVAARSALDAGNPGQALVDLDDFLQSHPGDERALALRGRALVALGRYSEALRAFQTVRAAGDPETHAWAQALMHEFEWGRAATALEQLLQRDPHNPELLLELTVCHLRLGRTGDALEIAARYAAEPGMTVPGQALIGSIHYQLGDYAAAAAAWDVALENGRPEPSQLAELPLAAGELAVAYGESLLEVGRLSDAVRELETSLAARDSARARLLLGSAYAEQGRMPAALQQWQQALRMEPDNAAIRGKLAQLAFDRQEPQQAIRLLRPLIEREQITAGQAALLQRAYAQLGDVDQAARWEKAAAKLQRAPGGDSIRQ